MQRRAILPFLLASLVPLACDHGHAHVQDVTQVAIDVVATDAQGFAYEGVEVHILEAWHEWSDCVCPAEGPGAFGVTGTTGRAVFDSAKLAASDVGFLEHPRGFAVLGSAHDQNEATVRLLVGHEALGWVQIAVPLTFREPFVEVFVEF